MNRQRRRHSDSRPGDVAVKVLAGAFVVIILTIAIKMGANVRSPQSQAHVASGDTTPVPAFAGDVLSIAAHFRCACGSCDVPELTECTCPKALEEKRFIRTQLDAGLSESEIIDLVAANYGYRKAIDGSGSDKKAEDPSSENGLVSVSATRSTVARQEDAMKIASRFTCACASCSDHILSECKCDHPRGSVEMKAFIDYKIAQQRYSVDQIVDAIALEYGHLRP